MLYNKVILIRKDGLMPPKAKYTREEIVKKAFEMTRENGIEAVVARELGKRLGTSSSPIFTAFKNMEELHAEVAKLALEEFETYISDALNYTPAFKYVGMKMIEFATNEPKLFKVVYMREHDRNHTYSDLIEDLGAPVGVCIDIMQKEYKLSRQEAEFVFKQEWLYTFGICVLVSGNVCYFTPEEKSNMLTAEFQGILMLVKSGKFKTNSVKSLSGS